MLKIDGHDDAIVGQACVWVYVDGGLGREDVLVYSGEKILAKLMERDDMEYEDGLDYISFNIEGAYLGPQTPIVVWVNEDGYDEE